MMWALVTLLSPPRVGALSDDARLTSVCLSVCLSVAYIRPKLRTKRPRKTKIGTEPHVTRTPFARSKGQLAGGGGTLWRPPAQLVSFSSPPWCYLPKGIFMCLNFLVISKILPALYPRQGVVDLYY